MNTRNLLIIAAVPGFRANTKLEREDNNAPRVKIQPLDIYADLVLGRPRYEVEERRKVKLSDLDRQSRIFQQTTPAKQISERERFLREYMTAPVALQSINDLAVNLNDKTVFYKGRWWTEREAGALSSIERSRMADAYQKAKGTQAYYTEQPKARPRPADKL